MQTNPIIEVITMIQRILSYTALATAVLLLNSCGFATAPLGYGAAYAGKGTVKAADKGIEYGKRTANVVVDTAIYVGEAAIEGLEKDPDAPPQRGTLRSR
jgi:hypothetical protein